MAFSASISSQQSEINVTPLIDVLLVMLIIFMVIVPVTPRGLESEVPQEAHPGDQSMPPLLVRVSGQPDLQAVVYTIDGRTVDRVQVGAALQADLGVRANRSVWIEASPGLSYRLVAEVIGKAKAAGASAIGLARIS